MNRVGEILAYQQEQRLAARSRILTSQSSNSIERSVINTNPSIEIYVKAFDRSVEIPAEIDSLIDDKDYRKKYGAMICRGHKEQLLQLARYTRSLEAAGKLDKEPWHFFSTFAKYSNWERTLKFLAGLTEVRELAERVAKKLKPEAMSLVLKEIVRGVNVERWADLAQEAPHDKPGQSTVRYFAWLCQREAAAMG
jgi:hypothetical protein